MRVTNTAISRNYTGKMNKVQERLTRSFNKIQGREYEAAAESPLSYYKGKNIDDQYQEALAKSKLLTDVRSRLEQQEMGVYDIQTTLSAAKNDIILKARTATTSDTALQTLRDDLLQKEHNMVNDLLTQYQDFYVYGGNDVSTPPFSLNSDGTTLTYSHIFPGEGEVTKFVFQFQQLEDDVADTTATGYGFKLDEDNSTGSADDLIRAMSEQGHMDLGYGDIRDRDTLIDTYTGGMNVLTSPNLTSAALKADDTIGQKEIEERISNGPLGLIAQSIHSINTYLDSVSSGGDRATARATMNDELGNLITDMTICEHEISTIYADLGNKYSLTESLETKLKKIQDTLTEQYTDALGADPYEAIYEMYNNQYAYSAALQVGSNILGSSLFDFMR